MKNNLRVTLLMLLITFLFLFVGRTLGGPQGMITSLFFATLMNFGTYWFSSSIVLKMTRAQPADPVEHRTYIKMIEDLADQARIPVPKLYIVPDLSPNAFATGRNPEHGIVALNQGILNLLDKRELEGVIAHEMAHIKHRDTLTSAIVATLAGAIVTLVDVARWTSIFSSRDDEDSTNPVALFVASIFVPLAAMMIQMAVSRSREYEADHTAAMIIGSSRGLASALLKLEGGVRALPGQMAPSRAHLCIVNPLLGGAGGFLMNLFSTHPPIEKRVEKLAELEAEMGFRS